jgi:hypothetical protein
MGVGRPPQQNRRPCPAVRAFAFALLGLLAAGAPAQADLRPPGRMRGAPPMRFVRVVSADPACAPNCPEWLSAEGQIGLGAAADFAKALEGLNGRRLPILIHSPGGSVVDAVGMGELVRAKGLAVAVARTLITNCSERAPRCPSGLGTAITGGAKCASACVLVLAGGVERLIGPAPLIGVHQITTMVRETEGLAHLTSERKVYEQSDVDAEVSAYLAAMGVGDPVMALMRKTPAASVRWLSLAELNDSRLATSALDATEPIAASGANGLNGHAFEGDPPQADLVQASVAAPLAGRSATLEITFRYRRGGGVVEAEATERDSAPRPASDPPAPDWSLTLSAPGAEPLQLSATGPTPARAIIPRQRFCALAAGGRLVAEPARGAGAGGEAEPLTPFTLAAIDGAKALIGDACP